MLLALYNLLLNNKKNMGRRMVANKKILNKGIFHKNLCLKSKTEIKIELLKGDHVIVVI